MINIDDARELINFSGGNVAYEKLGEEQLKAAVSLHNMMQENGGLGYLADEVGMGKTYIALGVVALLRYMNPNLKVLYILPKQNVLEKWHKKEYKNFLKHNIKIENHKVKTFNDRSATPQVTCDNLMDLITYSSAGYYGDFFIKMSSFSFPLSKTDKYLKEKLDDLKKLIPSFSIDKKKISKESVKMQYSQAINKVLPHFDLVIIDEAHNFRKGMESSARNEYLSIILGTSTKEDLNLTKKINKVLLLSATPYDRDIEQLKNQLLMVGMDKFANQLDRSISKDELISVLKQFMVRRLNRLTIENEEYTRNQYRVEKREQAAIELKDVKKKLLVALVQKKVGELLGFKGQYETGMLASFESYLPSTKIGLTKIESEFDDTKDGEVKTAIDNNIIEHLHESYTKRFETTSIPHPKMDSVVEDYLDDMLNNGRKHIIFVRRIQSVTDLKTKFDEGYDKWLLEYLEKYLQNYKTKLKPIVAEYKAQNVSKKSNVENQEENSANTFFTYFFRGENKNTVGTPFDIKNRLNTVSKDDDLITVFEVNWFHVYKEEVDLHKLKAIVNKYWKEFSLKYKKDKKPQKLTKNEKFLIIQTAYLEFINEKGKAAYYRDLYSVCKTENDVAFAIEETELIHYLHKETFFSNFSDIFSESFLKSKEEIEKIDFILSIISSMLRLGHGLIDIYIAYTNDSKKFIHSFVAILKRQKEDKSKFSTYQQIQDTIDNIDLIIRNNFADYNETKEEESFTKYIGVALSPLEAIVGARGGSGSKSAISRKFRMPGYPMILISTDVLQEGEDLHTFCDSVIHYGLANSPIAIEQKNGRVDRIGSLAQRNLQKDGFMEGTNKLQVSFPYLKESIEVIQVCNISKNLNDYLKSINSFETKSYSTKNDVNTDGLVIEAQITDKLESPFVTNSEYYEGFDVPTKQTLTSIIAKDTINIDNILKHINSLLKPYQKQEIEINIKIAKSSSVLLLELIKKDKEPTVFLNKKELLKYMKEHSYDKFHRTLAKVIDDKEEIRCVISSDIQILIGDSSLTHQLEIDEVFQRIEGIHHTKNKYTIDEIYSIANETSLTTQQFKQNHHVDLKMNCNKTTISMIFCFYQGSYHREQEVVLYLEEGYLVFESFATQEGCVNKLDAKDIIKYTWQRNNFIDIVEFVVNPEKAIIGRIAFPSIHVQNTEILYNAYVLACESDHLKQILCAS